MGMNTRQVVLRAELPLATPLMMTGVRTAGVQVVATATLAALVSGGGLGEIITLGYGQQDYGQIIAGAVLIAALALLIELVLVLLSWAVTPGARRLPLRPRAARPVPGDGPGPQDAGRVQVSASSPL